ncbi:MAG: helix-hairpin-helix domain-containing protein [Sulfurimonas sp.]|nr:helix-hairpin-helix domain-containing protein [Sulfurimonas sp.]PHQ90971.1 MAG: DNA-binding protein [Sulfurimonas sp.]
MKLLVLLTLTMSFLFGSVDINTASVKELTTLKGIGASKAKRIIDFRKENCFKNSKELTLVKGIGKKILKKNAGNIIVSKCKK